jgi:peptidylprolyl isomerase
MKFLALIVMLCIALSLFACGDDNSTPAAQALANSSDVTWKQVKSEIVEPQGPPPKELVVKELRKGSGPVSRDGDELSVRYINFDYNTGDGYEERWSPPRPFSFQLGRGEALDAWETGLKGMAVKGRRALIVPAKDAYGNTPQVYVLELVSLR